MRLTDQGFRFALVGGVFVRTDTSGILGIRPAFPSSEGQWIDDGAHAADVGVTPDGGWIVSLTDPRFAVGAETPAPGGQAVVVYRLEDHTPMVSRRIPVEDGRYCGMVAVASHQLALVRSDRSDYRFECVGSELDLLDLESGDLTEGVLRFDVPVRHLGVDGSGRYLIATTVDGSVIWRSLTGDGGTLAETGFIAADW